MDQAAVYRHAKELQQARTFAEVGRVAYDAILSLSRYRHSWLCIVEEENPDFARILQVSGDKAEVILEECPTVPIANDAMMQELVRTEGVVVVMEAATDPRTNKEIVSRLKNRTIINVPMRVGTHLVGALGMGTFGDEGVMAPTHEELEALVIFSVQLASAFDRVHALERHRKVDQERTDLALRLQSLQRVELMAVLASGVAHDLNNLLTVVQVNLEALEAGPNPEAARDAHAALRQSSQVCSQLLALGRAQAPRREPIDLNARLQATLRLVRPAIPRGVQVSHQREPHPHVVGDPVQLDQAFANLIINARDAVGEQGVIEVSTGTVHFDAAVKTHSLWARPGQFARVSVLDSGQGVPADILARIFDPLFTTKQHGTGLGLSVVASVAQQHQGLVHCESTPGRTRFDLYLPVADGVRGA